MDPGQLLLPIHKLFVLCREVVEKPRCEAYKPGTFTSLSVSQIKGEVINRPLLVTGAIVVQCV